MIEFCVVRQEVASIVSQLCMSNKSISRHVADSISMVNQMFGEIEPLMIARAVGYEREIIQFLEEIASTTYLQLLEMFDGDVALFPKFVVKSSTGIVLPPLASMFELNSVAEPRYDSTFKDVRDVYGVEESQTSSYEVFVGGGRDVDIRYRNYIFSMIAKCTYRVAVELVGLINDRLLSEIILGTREKQFGHVLYYIIEEPIREFFSLIDEGLRKNQLQLVIGGKAFSLSGSEVHLEIEMARAFAENYDLLFVEQMTRIIELNGKSFEADYLL